MTWLAKAIKSKILPRQQILNVRFTHTQTPNSW
jgi:hypothetical protein